MTLYELTGAYLQLQEMLYDEDADPDAIWDTLESIDGDIEEKADGYAKIISQMSADSDTLGKEIERLTNRKKSLDHSIDWLKRQLKASMETTGKTKFKTKLFSFSIANNPASLVIDDPHMIPSDYLVAQEPKIDKTAIKRAMDQGIDFSGIAHLEKTTRLSIK